ncbi:hypothetical protein GobsT_19750 [Gemmata obscuriglobus]|nr:hypothetical protein GobsT_19750 [Gemmata obscuriglobus]VTS03956.1 unnamed protein product [Gemmata obscuriglobus UQM 2246]
MERPVLLGELVSCDITRVAAGGTPAVPGEAKGYIVVSATAAVKLSW